MGNPFGQQPWWVTATVYSLILLCMLLLLAPVIGSLLMRL